MTKLFGLDIAQIINQSLGPGLLPLKLVKVTKGTRTAGALTSGTNPSEKPYPCRGVVSDFSFSQIDGQIIQRGDRRVLILGASLPKGIIPEVGDKTLAEGVTSEIVAIRRDPASATYECQVRGAA